MYKQTTLIFFILSILNKVRSYSVAGTLSCGQSAGTVSFDGSKHYWILDVSMAEQGFSVDTCGTYRTLGVDTIVELYEYDGSSSATSITDSNLEYVSVNDDCWCWTTPCYYYDSSFSYDSEYEDYYVVVVDDDDYEYTGSYYLTLDCQDIVAMTGGLECDEEVEESYWSAEEEFWFLDVSGASNSFSISTCGSKENYNVDTHLYMYGYEGSLSADTTYSDINDWTDLEGMNNDDNQDYCGDDDNRFVKDSYIYEESVLYDMYIVGVVEVFDSGVSRAYDLSLDCDGSSGDGDSELNSSASAGVLIVAIIVPLVFIGLAYWIYKNKNQEPQPQMGMYNNAGAMYR